MRRYLFFLLVVLFCFFNACDHKELTMIGVDKTLSFDANQIDTLLCDKINKVSFLALEATDKSDIREADKVVLKNDLIYIGDFHIAKIVVYDMSGKVKFILDKRGSGPQEYLELKSFAVDDQNIYIIDNSRSVMSIFDCYTGHFKESKPMPFVAWDIEVLGNDNLIFAFIPLQGGVLNKEQGLNKVFVTDKNLKIKKTYFKYEQDDYEFVGKTTYFTSTKNGVVFSSMDSDDYTVFFNTDSLKRIAVDFSDKIPEKYRKDRKKILESGYNFISQTPIIQNNYVAFEFSVGEDLVSYLYDENKKCFLSNPEVKSYNFLLQPVCSYQNKLVAYLDNYSLYQELVNTGFNKADDITESSLSDEGAVLVFYTMR